MSYKVIYDAPPDPATGARQQRSKTFRTRGEADDFLTQTRHALASRTYVETPKITFSVLAEQYLRTISPRIKDSTLIYYRIYVRNLTPFLNSVLIERIDPPMIQRAIAALAETRAPATVLVHASFLKAVFKQAVDWRILARTPCVGIVLPKDDKGYVEDRRIKAWTVDEAAVFLRESAWHPRYLIFRIALLTGMRRSEILALRWSDLDLTRGTIRVRATLSRTEGGKYLVSTPKTHGSNRLIHLDRETVGIVSRHREQTEDLDDARHLLAQDRYVFADDKGDFLHPDSVSDAFTSLVKRLDVPYISFHGLRHTHTSILFSTGQSLRVIMERLGHTTASMTLEHYAHGSPEADRKAADAISDALRVQSVKKSDDDEKEDKQGKEKLA